jgi:hypothetical protein
MDQGKRVQSLLAVVSTVIPVATALADGPLAPGSYSGRTTFTRTWQFADSPEPQLNSYTFDTAVTFGEAGLPTRDAREIYVGLEYSAGPECFTSYYTVTAITSSDAEVAVTCEVVTEFKICVDNAMTLSGTSVTTYRVSDDCSIEYTSLETIANDELSIQDETVGVLRPSEPCPSAEAEPDPPQLAMELLIEGPTSLAPGESAQLTAEIRYGDGTVADVTDLTTWQVLDADTALETGAATVEPGGSLIVGDDADALSDITVVAQVAQQSADLQARHTLTVVSALPEDQPPAGTEGAEPAQDTAASQPTGANTAPASTTACGAAAPMYLSLTLLTLSLVVLARLTRGR